MKKLLALSLVVLTLQGCSSIPVLGSMLGGGGTNVAANTQVGKTNSQTVGSSSAVENSVSPKGRVDVINQSNGNREVEASNINSITYNQMPVWLGAVLVILSGLLFPSAPEIGRMVRGLFTRKKS